MSPWFGTFTWISRAVPVRIEWMICGAYSAAPTLVERQRRPPARASSLGLLELGDVLLG